jgi:hypothetical protein
MGAEALRQTKWQVILNLGKNKTGREGESQPARKGELLCELGLRRDRGYLNSVLESVICINPAKSSSFLSC